MCSVVLRNIVYLMPTNKSSTSKHKPKRFYNKINKSAFFPEQKGVNRNKLKIADDSRFSVTLPADADKIAKIAIELWQEKHGKRKKPILTDATANVGGNSIGFGLSGDFKSVNSIELNPETCKMLSHNVKQYGLDKKNKVNVTCGDSIELLTTGGVKQDIIFFDPPWGGVGYKKHKTMPLYLSDKNMVDIINSMKGKAEMIVYKIPRNYDFGYFYRKLTFSSEIRLFKEFRGFYILTMMSND